MHGIIRITDKYNKMKSHFFFIEKGILFYEQWIAGHLFDGPIEASKTGYIHLYEQHIKQDNA